MHYSTVLRKEIGRLELLESLVGLHSMQSPLRRKRGLKRNCVEPRWLNDSRILRLAFLEAQLDQAVERRNLAIGARFMPSYVLALDKLIDYSKPQAKLVWAHKLSATLAVNPFAEAALAERDIQARYSGFVRNVEPGRFAKYWSGLVAGELAEPLLFQQSPSGVACLIAVLGAYPVSLCLSELPLALVELGMEMHQMVESSLMPNARVVNSASLLMGGILTLRSIPPISEVGLSECARKYVEAVDDLFDNPRSADHEHIACLVAAARGMCLK